MRFSFKEGENKQFLEYLINHKALGGEPRCIVQLRGGK
jgi:hypothetical protein